MDAHARGRRSVEVPGLGVDLREEVGEIRRARWPVSHALAPGTELLPWLRGA